MYFLLYLNPNSVLKVKNLPCDNLLSCRNSWEGNLELLAVDNLSNNEKKMHHNLMVLRVSWNLKRYKQIQLMTIEMENLRGSEIVYFASLRFNFVGNKTS